MSPPLAPRKIFFTRNWPPAIDLPRQRIGGSAGIEIDVFASEDTCLSREELLKRVEGCTGLFCLLTDKVDAEVLRLLALHCVWCPLRLLASNHIDVESCKARKLRVGHTPGVLDVAVAETAVALTFAAKRRVLECAASAKNGEWGVWQPFQYCGSDVTDSSIGVVGLERIGATYARMLKNSFNRKIFYAGPREKSEIAKSLGGDPNSVKYVDMETLLRQSDAISLQWRLSTSR
ncbi:hypothetical protein V7S43_017490 [Phytophthora oleae]|uniref:D-isomer specific 2-hydroxyacid dehydrogenase NAD-binding domain-containing protein n=1 Tax=Phytophthora oleae TaxID=2107226 RepID=A0ABD3ESQ2_9STRA